MVKALYGSAFRCAHPDCSKPLYRQDNETGDLVLNSRVAHIHARRPGGPRWIEMSLEENRGDHNLVLLCIEHSYEVDEHPHRYSAKLLREWKKAQREEHDRLHREWALTDVQVGQVLQASFSPAVLYQQAIAVVGVARASARLGSRARTARRGPAAAAAAWRASRDGFRRSSFGWDEDGNSIYAEPPRRDTERSQAALVSALDVAVTHIEPLADDVRGELAAARASRPDVERWVNWVARMVDATLKASSGWPGLPELEDDGRLEAALEDLAQATDALAATWRGDGDAPHPPPVDMEAEPQVNAPDAFQQHRDLLERARPYQRVDHRSYDAALRAELGNAAERATAVPPILSALPCGLSATCALAAAVARNATDDELEILLREDARRRPISAAVLLIAEHARIAQKGGRSEPRARADQALAELWESVDWSDQSSWDTDDCNGEVIFWQAARLRSHESVKEVLSAAVAQAPDIILRLVHVCAPWIEEMDYEDGATTGIRRRYGDLPPWFPIEAISQAAHTVAPNIASVAVDRFGDTKDDHAEALLAQVLWRADIAT